MGLAEILTIIFVVFKLVGVITWSWWLVLLPELIAVGFYVFVFVLSIVGVGVGTKHTMKHFNGGKK